MIRTQISLDVEEYRLAKEEAAALGISVAELLRRGLRQMLGERTSSQRPWMRYAGMVESGDPQSSLNVDDLIYGSKT